MCGPSHPAPLFTFRERQDRMVIQMDVCKQTNGQAGAAVRKTADSPAPLPPTAIDLFAGCGGLTQGLRDAGFEVVGAVEMDPIAAETYALNHPDANLLIKDVREVSPCDLLEGCSLYEGELDLLAACPPCQGFSRMPMNNRPERLSDVRNRLVDDVLRFVEGLRPRTVMLENVPNLARYSRYRRFKASLRKLGYRVSDAVVDVADYGVPQRRRRLVLLASSIGTISLADTIKRPRTVRDAIGGLPAGGLEGDPLHDVTEHRSERVRQLIAHIPKDGGSRSSLPEGFGLRCHAEHDGFHDVYGRMRWDDVSPTITGGCINPSKGRFLHPEEDRAITLREAALLQSFPPPYKFSLRRGKYAAAEMIGNALPPGFSYAQALAIRQHLMQAPTVATSHEC